MELWSPRIGYFSSSDKVGVTKKIFLNCAFPIEGYAHNNQNNIMKRVILIIVFSILLQSCASLSVPPGVSVDHDVFFSRSWHVAVLDLNYEFEDEGRIGATEYVSAGVDGGNVISGLLAMELSSLDNLTIIERDNIAEILEEQSFQLSGMTDPDSAIDLGRLSGADAVVVGDLTDYVYWENTGVTGTTVSFSMRMIDVETGKVLLNGSISRVRTLVDIFPNAQLTTKELINAMELSN